MSDYLMPTYARLPVTFTSGQGAWLQDTNGRRVLDALSGIAVCNLGHAHPAITAAITQQAQQLVHTSNLYGVENQTALAAKLCAVAQMDKVFFSNSGAEANEAAIKLARLYGHSKGYNKPTIITAHGSFHGRTMATLSATGNPKVKTGFAPLVEGFVHVDYNNIDALAALMESTDDLAAVMLEPVQGEGGVNIPAADYLPKVRELCDRHGVLFILDEIQTGVARTGQWYAWQHSGARPDILTSAKGLGNGMPIGACMAQGAAAELFAPGHHGSTFGGNPLACAAALAVLNTIETEQLNTTAQQMGQKIQQMFVEKLADNPLVVEIRHLGLMIGVQLTVPCSQLVTQALEHGLLLNVTGDQVIRLLPPLIINDAEAQQIVDTVCALVSGLTE